MGHKEYKKDQNCTSPDVDTHKKGVCSSVVVSTFTWCTLGSIPRLGRHDTFGINIWIVTLGNVSLVNRRSH